MTNLIEIFIFIFGASVGSFIYTSVLRTKAGVSLWNRSKCRHCQKSIYFYDLIPLISFFVLKRKCRFCKKRISFVYPIIEFISGLLFLFIFLHHGFSILLIRDLFFLSILFFIFLFDLYFYEIPDRFIFPAIIISFLLNNFFFGYSFEDLLVASISVSSFFAFLFFISQGKWIGGGDIRMGVLMGVMLGFYHSLFALSFAYILGMIVAITLILLRKKTWKSELPFGSFLSISIFIMLIFGTLIQSYF